MSNSLYAEETFLTSHIFAPLLARVVASSQSRYAYVSQVDLFVKRFLRRADYEHLRAHCEYVIAVHEPPADRHYKQTVVLLLPDEAALRYLHTRFDDGEGYKLIFVSVSLDNIFPTEEDAKLCTAIRKYNLAQSHRSIEAKRFDYGAGNYSDRKRHPRNRSMAYDDRAQRHTGELYCSHWDWHLGTAAAVRAVGIHNLLDLGNFDASAFWQARMRLMTVDWSRLGRAIHARHTKTRQRRTTWYCNGQDMDQLVAINFLHQIQDGRDVASIDNVIQACRKRSIAYRSGLIRHDGSALVPPASRLFMSSNANRPSQTRRIPPFQFQPATLQGRSVFTTK